MAERIATSVACGSANGPYRVPWTLTYDQVTPTQLILGIGKTAPHRTTTLAHAQFRVTLPVALASAQRRNKCPPAHRLATLNRGRFGRGIERAG